MAGDVLTCAYCSKPGVLHRDHVVPRSRGGPDSATNIVMACQACNSSKSDRLPSEWLGERCPAAVLLIETRVNAQLKAIYKRRDKAAAVPSKLFAFSTTDEGRVRYIGEVVSETPGAVRIHAVNCLNLMFGHWDPNELVDVPRALVRLFADRDRMLDAVDAAG